MNTRSMVKATIRAFVGHENVIPIPRTMVKFMGSSLGGGALLNQILYWSGTLDNDRDGWFYKTDKEWQEEICISRRQVRKHVDRMREMGFLETMVKKRDGRPMMHYRIDWDMFQELLIEFLEQSESDCPKRDKPGLSQTEQSSYRDYKDYKTKTTTEMSPEKSVDRPPANGFCKPAPVKPTDASSFDVKCAQTLAKAVCRTRGYPGNINTKEWANHFRLMRTKDKIPAEKIKDAILWYVKHIGEFKVPEAECGRSFREKFVKIQNAQRRDSHDNQSESSIENEVSSILKGIGR